MDRPQSVTSQPTLGEQRATPVSHRDLEDLTPEGAREFLVETLLRIGLDLDTVLAVAGDGPVSRHLHSAVHHVDEAVRQVRHIALRHLDEAVHDFLAPREPR
ncbi:MAG TPA: hypothetical protein VFN97_17645 [Actinospica sp.]|nr:hypothetical protein [Actinospica sp.]